MTRSLRAAALLTAVLATACGDAPTEPAALEISEETALEFMRTAVAILAQTEIGGAVEAEARCADASTPVRDEVSVRRGRRLLDHAREALTEGDLELALQRAHYAEALLADACPAHREPKE